MGETFGVRIVIRIQAGFFFFKVQLDHGSNQVHSDGNNLPPHEIPGVQNDSHLCCPDTATTALLSDLQSLNQDPDALPQIELDFGRANGRFRQIRELFDKEILNRRSLNQEMKEEEDREKKED